MKTIKLKDKRILAYEEYGDPKGKPVFYFHGFPASRLSGKQLAKVAEKLKLRFISPDRPGFGFSTFKPNRKLLDWPDDIIQLANWLRIKKFSVVGSSGGAPYVLACAYKIPERLNSVVVIAGLGPLHLSKREGLTLKHFLMLRTACLGPKLAFPNLLFDKISLDYFPGLYTLVYQPDKEIRKKPSLKKLYVVTQKEAFRQGIKGPAGDLAIYGSNWGFDLRDINIKIKLWHGKRGRNVPFWLGKYVASRLKDCEANYIESAGHFLIASMGEKIFSQI